MTLPELPVVVWIVAGGVAMSAIALVGAVALVLPESVLQKLILPLVAFAALSLIGGALFHMLPAAAHAPGGVAAAMAWVALGFLTLFALEQFLHYHHCHRASADCRQPLTYLVLVGDGLHNLLGGMAVAGTFLIDVPARVSMPEARLARHAVRVQSGRPRIRERTVDRPDSDHDRRVSPPSRDRACAVCDDRRDVDRPRVAS